MLSKAWLGALTRGNGDAFLIGTGVANGFGRAALYLQPRASFDHVALLKLDLEPVRARVFNLENRVNQDLMRGFDEPKSQFFGLDIGLFGTSEAEPSPPTAVQKQAPKAAQAVQTTRVKKEVPDLWSAGFEFFHFYDADSTPETFSFAPGEPSPALSIFGNRKGLNVYSGYLAGSLFEFDRNMLLYSQFALERNDAADRRVKAAAWYVEPGYKFSMLPWSPQLNLRYAHFSGDPNPNDRLKQSYDPLFTTGGSRGFRQLVSRRDLRAIHQRQHQFRPPDGSSQNLAAGYAGCRHPLIQFLLRPARAIQQSADHLEKCGAGGRLLYGVVGCGVADDHRGGRVCRAGCRTEADRPSVCHG
jgi:hypothetical protein